jgi:hypothetical protein
LSTVARTKAAWRFPSAVHDAPRNDDPPLLFPMAEMDLHAFLRVSAPLRFIYPRQAKSPRPSGFQLLATDLLEML